MARTKTAPGNHGAKGKKRPRDTELRKGATPSAVRKHRWHALTKRKFDARRLMRQTTTLIRHRPFSRLLNAVVAKEASYHSLRIQRKARDAIHVFSEDMVNCVLRNAVAMLKLVGNGQTLRPRHLHMAVRCILTPMPNCADLEYTRMLPDARSP